MIATKLYHVADDRELTDLIESQLLSDAPVPRPESNNKIVPEINTARPQHIKAGDKQGGTFV